MKYKLLGLPAAAGVCVLCAVFCLGARGQQANTESAAAQEARNQAGEIVHGTTPSVLPGTYRTMADARRALQTYDAVFAAYSRTALLSPPRGFEVLNNYNVDARNTPRGWPIPVGGGLILLAYDSTKRLPSGRFAREGEGPILGGISINQIDCANPADPGLGEDQTSKFYYPPKQTGTVGGWPKYDRAFGGYSTFLSRRTQPRWLPVTVERILNLQLGKAREQLKTLMADQTPNRVANGYDEWLKGRDERLRQYQQTHDQLAKTSKEQADKFLAAMLKADEENGKNLQAMAKNSGSLNQQLSGYQANASKAVQDLEAHLNSLTAEQRRAPAYVYEGTETTFAPGQVVPAGTPGGLAVVYPNPDFYDRTLPPWEAQSICVTAGGGPNTQRDSHFPTILKIWDSLDWDAIAKVLK